MDHIDSIFTNKLGLTPSNCAEAFYHRYDKNGKLNLIVPIHVDDCGYRSAQQLGQHACVHPPQDLTRAMGLDYMHKLGAGIRYASVTTLLTDTRQRLPLAHLHKRASTPLPSKIGGATSSWDDPCLDTSQQHRSRSIHSTPPAQ